jgi:UDP-2,3-diacylglucosamine hydrolase
MDFFIKQGAIFVADSHFNQKNKEFLILLKKIENKEILPPQIFLMGDMIDFISSECKYFVKQNMEIIELLNKLSKDIEIVYLEGNHDFNLKELFSEIKIVKRENQPLLAKYENKTVSLSHGDNFINWKYDLFCKIVRNRFFLKFMNFIDVNFFISKKIEEVLCKKNICHKIDNFEKIVLKRLKNYNTDIVIEGHYHQGKIFFIENKKYLNIPSLCCQKKYMKFNNSNFEEESICILP